MHYDESIEQLKSLIEHFNNVGNDFNATDIETIKYLLKQSKKQKEVIDKAIEYIETESCFLEDNEYELFNKKKLLDILKEVSE